MTHERVEFLNDILYFSFVNLLIYFVNQQDSFAGWQSNKKNVMLVNEMKC
jgi:hypothetical protein